MFLFPNYEPILHSNSSTNAGRVGVYVAKKYHLLYTKLSLVKGSQLIAIPLYSSCKDLCLTLSHNTNGETFI